MAEAVLRSEIRVRGLDGRIVVDSAGTGDWHVGHPPHEGTRKLLDRYGIGYEGMFARLFIADDFARFDYIVCMDSSNERNVLALKPAGEGGAQVIKLLDLVPESQSPDVPDPYFTGNFDEVYELIKMGCDRLIERMLRETKDAPPV
jgi:protein-tyrosine phosphatase